MIFFAIQFKQEYLYDPSYADKNSIFKVFYLIGCMHITIYRLFFAFGTLEANMIASGISYRAAKSEDQPEEYNSIRHVHMWGFQTHLHGQASILNWNECTTAWLKYYV